MEFSVLMFLQQRHLQERVRMYDIALCCVLSLSPLHHYTPMKCAISTRAIGCDISLAREQ